MNQIVLLQNVPLFETLSLDELILISQELIQEEFLQDETILAAGDIFNYCYIIASGTVTASKMTEEGAIAVRELTAGSMFGYLDLFDDRPSQLQFVAQTDCELLKISKKRLVSLGYQRPQILISICQTFSATLQQLVHQKWMQELYGDEERR
ncbi:Crp/Fnr family transcriptional regulator [Roseofilum casamattae]|uniref:Cyclic nucleotide-binding domain-containing protein n=1 Tax=Roseofilum casamattae BLCC-M143 TaxID=3022442 RepID=A0ABT7C4F7_9CYAN|nr:cyclic nucleotide-binding domain-containing protein [Roseofilum casamattae]MDJ1185751.1 cyclic nucleotide-binding domain-containing protein [Roseofilum casamattae BLCC-M143]